MNLESSQEKRQINWVNTSFLLGFPLMLFILLPINISQGVALWILPLAFMHYVAEGISITGGYHRLFSHRSYDAHWSVELLYLLFGASAFQNSALQWCVQHRLHHKEVDHEKDPYNINKGFFWAHMGWIFFKPPEELDLDKIPNDLKKSKLVMWQHKYYLPIAVVMGVVLPTLIYGFMVGDYLSAFTFAVVARVLFTSHCTYFINSLAHMWGKQTFSTSCSAKDNPILAFFTFGEGYHNFHHKFQADYRNGIRWWQFDPTKWLIQVLNFFGLAKKLRKTDRDRILLSKMEVRQAQLTSEHQNTTSIMELKERAQASFKKLQLMKRDFEKAKKEGLLKTKEAANAYRKKVALAQKAFKLQCNEWYLQQTFYLKYAALVPA